MTEKEPFDLLIRKVNIAEAKEIMQTVRRIERRNPDHLFIVIVKGLDHKTSEEIAEVIKKIYPRITIIQEMPTEKLLKMKRDLEKESLFVDNYATLKSIDEELIKRHVNDG
jgi:molybdenum cofactor biosynthesis enzyme MoaA